MCFEHQLDEERDRFSPDTASWHTCPPIRLIGLLQVKALLFTGIVEAEKDLQHRGVPIREAGLFAVLYGLFEQPCHLWSLKIPVKRHFDGHVTYSILSFTTYVSPCQHTLTHNYLNMAA